MARTAVKSAADKRVPASNKLKAFEDAIALANREIKSDSGTLIAKLSDRPLDVETISSGSVVIDSITGGGFPKGRLIEIYGPESSGKTSVALTTVGNVQKDGGTAVFVDLENALDPRYARKLGVDTDQLAVAQPDYAEQALQLVFNLARSGTVDIIVIDSIASLVPKAELEGDVEQQTIGLLARIMSKTLKQLAGIANRTGTTVLFINQTRDAIGSFSPFGTPQTTPGGKAMKFYASQRIEVKRMGQVKEGKEVIGNEVRVKVVKNKVAPPFGQGVTVLTFGHGINRAAEMIEVGPDNGVITVEGRTYSETATGEKIATKKSDAVAFLEGNPEMLDRLSLALKSALTEDLFRENSEPDTDEEVFEEDADEESGEDFELEEEDITASDVA